ncbi:putative ABC transporter ATP-binding protein [uncultured archaeon]|nr:putative ABC transporter ATP-binding protein [uncultured archaeon]
MRPGSASDVVLKMEHVTKVYEGDPPFRALDDISLEIRRGEIISIIGPSGSGKSTLLHLLGCLDKPSGGEIFLDGQPVSKMDDNGLARARRETIGFVFQAFNLAPTLNVFQNVELPLIIRGLPPEARRPLVDKHLAVVGLSDKARNMTSQISGGQKQRVAVARSLVTSPKILLADEPTGNLDSKSSDEVIQFIMGLCKERAITVIFVTHDPRIAGQTERQIRILDGKIESDTITKPAIRKHKPGGA